MATDEDRMEMKLFSVCVRCDVVKPYDSQRHFLDFDKCKCGDNMDVWTESGIRNQELRRQWATPNLIEKTTGP